MRDARCRRGETCIRPRGGTRSWSCWRAPVRQLDPAVCTNLVAASSEKDLSESRGRDDCLSGEPAVRPQGRGNGRGLWCDTNRRPWPVSGWRARHRSESLSFGVTHGADKGRSTCVLAFVPPLQANSIRKEGRVVQGWRGGCCARSTYLLALDHCRAARRGGC